MSKQEAYFKKQRERSRNVWVVMPCFNEEDHISSSIKDVLKYTNNLVVVDDGSDDNTYKIARKHCKNVLKHAINLGKGAALKTGSDYALKRGAERLVFIDSDGQHEAKEIPRFVGLLDDYDFVFGSRKLDKNMPSILRFGNYMLTNIAYALFGVRLHDTQSGYRALTAEAYKKVRWKAQDYSVETEMIANVGKNKLKYKEIEISTIYKNRYKGTTVFDGLKIGIKMLFYKLQR